MKHPTALRLAFGLMLGAMTAAAPAAAQENAKIVVLRGNASETVDTSQATAEGVPVLRGKIAETQTDAELPPLMLPQAQTATGWQVIAGRKLWLVNFDQDRLIGCELEQTIQVGVEVIECIVRRLPRSARF